MVENKIFIYGVPGVGKTYFSKHLGKKLEVNVIEGDLLKRKARKHTTETINPFLLSSTCRAYEKFGELNYENAVKGLKAVRSALQQVVSETVSSRSNFVLEAAFLDPQLLRDLGTILLLTTKDEKLHKNYFLHHREKLLDFAGNEFKAARFIQNFLIEEAKKLNIQTIENGNLEGFVSSFLGLNK